MRISKPKWTLWLAALVLILGYGLPAVAQEATQEPSEDELIAAAMERSFEEEITVTGSLIPRADLTALSPVTVMEVPQELTYSGITRIEDLVVSLPQVFSGQNSTIANGATGTATIDLRYLGTARTLVLINGRRLAPGDAGAAWAPDINVIPAALVKRVDVLTGGASTVYGSDAVAGVVNFVMDHDFSGVRGGFQYAFYNHNNDNALAQQINQELGFDVPTGSSRDGQSESAYVALGSKFADGKGHASAYITYRNIDAVLKGDRDYTNCAVGAGDDGPYCSGSTTIAFGRFVPYRADDSRIGDFVLHIAEDGGDGQSFRPRTGDVYNYAPWNHLQRPDEKWNAGAFAHYTINDHFEPYIEAMFMSNYTDAQIAPSGNFNRVRAINCDNPMLSPQQWEIVCGEGTGYGPTDVAYSWIYRRNVEGGNRTNQIGHDNYRLVAGLRGDINDQWSYDLYYLTAQNHQFESYINDLNTGRIADALDVIGDPDDPSTWECRSGNTNCAPWNIFSEGGVTQEAIDYISTVAVMYGRTRTDVTNLTFTSDWEDYGIMIPSASEGIQIAVGGEYRKQWLENMPDEVYLNGLRAGSGGLTPRVDNEYSVEELFFEALIPLVQDARGFRDLSLELGYRYSDYSLSGAFDTWKVQASWAPTESWRIRGGYNRAVRAPNIWELYRPQGFGLGGAEDICSGTTPSATLEQCMNTGVTAAQYGDIFPNDAQQYNTLSGGNPDLIPETADTITAGLVWTPQSIAGLSITLDYYDIEITDAVGNLAADDIIQQCAVSGDPQLCSLIHRDRFGSLWATEDGFTETTSQNIGTLIAEGVDLNGSYMIGLGNAGYLPLDLTGTYMLQSKFSNPLTSYDCVGYYGLQCLQPQSVWRHKLRATWESAFNLNVSLGWRYVGGAEVDDASPNPALANPANMPLWEANDADKTPAYNWFDLAASYTFRNGIKLTLGINNVLDEEPPLWPNLADEINTYGTYEPMGRYIFTSLQFDF